MLTAEVLPEQKPPLGSHLSSLHKLFGEDGEIYFASRVNLGDLEVDEGASVSTTKAEAMIMGEVAHFLQTRHCDEFWLPRSQSKNVSMPSHGAMHH